MRTIAAKTSQTQPGTAAPAFAEAADKSPVLGMSGVWSTGALVAVSSGAVLLASVPPACGEFAEPVFGVPGVAVFGDAVGTSAEPPEL